MHVVKVVVWKDKRSWLGYLQEYPDYWSQGESLEDLREHLKISGGPIYNEFDRETASITRRGENLHEVEASCPRIRSRGGRSPQYMAATAAGLRPRRSARP